MSGLIDGKLFVKITELDPATDFTSGDEFVFVQDGTTLKLTGQSITDSVTAIGNLASKGYVDTLVDSVVDSAPGTLDTLRELAFALNDDENFASHIIGVVNGKLTSTDFGTYFDSEFAAKNTYHLVEGSNLYFTNERGRASVFDADDIINFNNGGQVGNAQLVHEGMGGFAEGMDIYSPASHEWVQLNYNDKNYVWVTNEFVGIDVSNSTGNVTWRFNGDGVLALPEDGDIVDSNGDSVLRPTDPSFTTVTLTGPITSASQAVTKEYVDTATSGVTFYDTDGLPEGAVNKYYTDARARAAFSAGTGISITNGVITATGGGGNVGTDPTFTSVTTTDLNVKNVAFTGTGAVTITSGNDLNLVAAGQVKINGETFISLEDLKSVVASSTDFADFKSRVAGI